MGRITSYPCKNLKRKSGFSLMEVIVAGAIVSVIGAGITSMYVQSARVQSSTEQDAQITSLSNLVQIILGGSISCGNALTGVTFNPSGSVTIPTIQMGGFGGVGGITLTTGSSTNNIQITSMTLVSQGLSETFIDSSTSSTDSVYAASFNITFQKASGSMGVKASNFTSYVKVVVPGTGTAPVAISGCFGQTSTAQSQMDACSMFGGTYTPGTPSGSCAINNLTIGSPTTQGNVYVYNGTGPTARAQLNGQTVYSFDSAGRYAYSSGSVIQTNDGSGNLFTISGPNVGSGAGSYYSTFGPGGLSTVSGGYVSTITAGGVGSSGAGYYSTIGAGGVTTQVGGTYAQLYAGGYYAYSGGYSRSLNYWGPDYYFINGTPFAYIQDVFLW